jgi:hypothetical protein
MATYRVKQATINAVQHPGPEKLVVVGRKGEQVAHTGDFIIFYGERPEDREVITNKDFFDRYEIEPLQKTSGDGFGAGDWTESGDGTNYPQTETHVDQSEPVAGVDKTTPEAYENAVESAHEAEEAPQPEQAVEENGTADTTEGGATDL